MFSLTASDPFPEPQGFLSYLWRKKNGHFVQHTVRPPRSGLALAHPWYLEPKLQIYIKIIIM